MQFFSSPLFNLHNDGAGAGPLFEIEHKDNTVLLKATVPHTDLSQMQLQVQPREVRIRGSKEVSASKASRMMGVFEMVCTLPVTVDPQSATAEIKQGMLYVTMHRVKVAIRKPTVTASKKLRALRVEEAESARRK